MKNIAFFNSTSFWGGGEKLHLDHAMFFAKHGYQTSMICKQNCPLSTRSKSANIPVFEISIGDYSFLNLIKVLSLVCYYKKQHIDTVVFSTSEDVKIGSIAAKIAGVKRIVYLRGLAVPIKNKLINRWVLGFIVTHIIANSMATKSMILKNLYKIIPSEKVHIIYHGITLPTGIPERLDEIPVQQNKIILGNAGRLSRQKGQKHLIHLAQILKEKNVDFTLYIAGTGELYDELENLIKVYKLSGQVILLGFVSEMERFMASIDVFVLSSLFEGFGYVIAEAMSYHKPVVAFDISSNPEIITNNQTGLLSPLDDIQMMANHIEKLIKDPTLRQKIGDNAYQSVVDRFLLENSISEFEQYLLQQ